MNWLTNLLTSETTQQIANEKNTFWAYITVLFADAFDLFMMIPDEFLGKLLSAVTITGLIILAALNAVTVRLRLKELAEKTSKE